MLSDKEEEMFQQVFKILLRLDPVTERVPNIDEIRKTYKLLKAYAKREPTFEELILSTSQLTRAIDQKDPSLLKKINE